MFNLLGKETDLTKESVENWPVVIWFLQDFRDHENETESTQPMNIGLQVLREKIHQGELRSDYFAIDDQGIIYSKYSLREWEAFTENDEDIARYFFYSEKKALFASGKVYPNVFNVSDNQFDKRYNAELKKAQEDNEQAQALNRNKVVTDNVNSFIREALSRQSICIGETQHESISPKLYLIGQLPILHEAGFTHILLEHFHQNSQQILLDEFFNTGKMPHELVQYLKYLDNHFNLKAPYRHYDLLVACQKNDIRPIAIETNESYFFGMGGMDETLYQNRILMMNSLFKEAVEKYCSHTKWIGFVGGAHLHTEGKIVGVAERTNSISIMIEDANRNQVAFDSTSSFGAFADCVIQSTPPLIYTKLYEAVIQGDAKRLKELLSHKERDLTGKDGATLLSIAAQYGFTNLIDQLISAEVNPNASLSITSNLFLSFVQHAGSRAKIENLIKSKNNGLIPEILDSLTPLHIAICENQLETVKALLGNGADPGFKSNGISPLDLAHAMDNADLVNELESSQKRELETPASFSYSQRVTHFGKSNAPESTNEVYKEFPSLKNG